MSEATPGRKCEVCGDDIRHKRADATVCGNTCRVRKHRDEKCYRRYWGDTQEPLLDARAIEWLENRERQQRDLVIIMEADDNLIGRTLQGHVGTPMGGQGGILSWAAPLYAADRRKKRAELARRQAQVNRRAA